MIWHWNAREWRAESSNQRRSFERQNWNWWNHNKMYFITIYSQDRSSAPPKIQLRNLLFEKWRCQIQIGIPACVMSCENSMRTSLYLFRLKIFEWVKFHRRHLHQIQGNLAGRNCITNSHVNSPLITHARMQTWIWNLQLPTDSTFE